MRSQDCPNVLTFNSALKATKNALSTARTILLLPGSAKSLIGQSLNLRKRYSSVRSVDELVSKHMPELIGYTATLDLGCGGNIRNPFGATKEFGVDIRNDLSENIKHADLSVEAIPFADDSFDFCTAFDVLEHIPRHSWAHGRTRMAFLDLMNEIHRVLKPGGFFLHSTPAYPSKQAFQDPTHVNIITEDTIPNYFCEPCSWARNLGYGFSGSFELIEQRWLQNIWLVGIIKALK